MGKARPIMTMIPNAKDGAKRPSAAEVRNAIKSDAKRLLGPFNEKVQRQRGLTKKLAEIRVV